MRFIKRFLLLIRADSEWVFAPHANDPFNMWYVRVKEVRGGFVQYCYVNRANGHEGSPSSLSSLAFRLNYTPFSRDHWD